MADNQRQNQKADISGLFKELDHKEGPQTSGFQKSYQSSKIIQWTMWLSGGRIKTEKQATYVLLGFVVLVIIISLFLLFSGGGSSDTDLRQQRLYSPGSPAIQ